MNKALLGLMLGGILGIFDGLTAWFTPEVRSAILQIVVGSTIKGLLAVVLIGFFARKEPDKDDGQQPLYRRSDHDLKNRGPDLGSEPRCEPIKDSQNPAQHQTEQCLVHRVPPRCKDSSPGPLFY